MERSRQELKALQGLDLETKIMLSKDRIRQWVETFGEKGVYISFSGGKDSTCLLHMVREMYPDVEAVYVDTGLEYPEVREFVKTFDNVTWLKPAMNFKQVIMKYGYPMISKEVSCSVYDYRRWKERKKDNPGIPIPATAKRLKQIGVNVGGRYDYSKYEYLADAPFKIGNQCCKVMKKNPFHKYEKETNKKGMTGQMASESLLRESNWIRYGCNAFENKRPLSNPFSIWTEQDILQYIKKYNIKIASVYGDIVEDWNGEECAGQTSFGIENVKFKTTGCDRTGCMFCGYGAHLDKSPNRFERMKVTHPATYNYIMKPIEQGGLGYKEMLDWFNEHSPRKIKY